MWKKTVAYLHIQQRQSNISINLELCFWPPSDCKSNIKSLLALFLVSTNLWGNVWLLSCYMLHYVDQLVDNFVCLLFGVAEVAHTQFELFRYKLQSDAAWDEVVESIDSEPKH